MKTTIRNRIRTIIIVGVLILTCTVLIAEPASAKNLPKHLRILAVGNSLTQNSLYYVYDMAKELGIEEVTVGNLFIGGCSLRKHWNNAKNDKKAYTYYRKEKKKWIVRDDTSISEALADREWDYVVFSPYSGDAGRPGRYKQLSLLADYVRDRVGEDTVFVWNMTWAYKSGNEARSFAPYNYDQQTMYESIVNTTQKKVLTNEHISMIIPSGTTVQNARTSCYGDNFTRDGRHLKRDARYMVGLTWLCTLLDLSPRQIKYCPEEITPEMRKVAVTAAEKALKHPYEISPIGE